MDMKKFKKAGLRIACLLFGLSTFTACYGPAPYIEEEPDPIEEQTTKADAPEDSEASEAEADESEQQ